MVVFLFLDVFDLPVHLYPELIMKIKNGCNY